MTEEEKKIIIDSYYTSTNKNNVGILILPFTCNYIENVLDIIDKNQYIKFIVHPRDKKYWQIFSRKIDKEKYTQVVPIMSEENIKQYCDDCIFAHKKNYLSIFETKKSAVKIAKLSIDKYNNDLKIITKQKSNNYLLLVLKVVCITFIIYVFMT